MLIVTQEQIAAVTFHLVRKHAHVPLSDREAVEQCGLSTERDEINMSGGDTCNAVASGQHAPSLQRGQPPPVLKNVTGTLNTRNPGYLQTRVLLRDPSER